MSYVGVPPFGQTVRTVTEVVAQQDQSVFYPTGGYIPGYLDVELDGSDLGSQDFTATDGLSVVLTQKCGAGDLFRTKAYWPVAMADTMRRAEINGIVGAGGWAMRNRLINGDMRVDQRNAGASVNIAATGYNLDRWVAYVTQSSKLSVQQTPNATEAGYAARLGAGFSSYLGATSSSAYSLLAGDFFLLSQIIEGQNFSDMAWGTPSAKPVTLSFWVRSSLTGTFSGSIFQANVTNACYVFTYTVNAANTWEQKTITIPGPTIGTWPTNNTASPQLVFNLGTGSTNSTSTTGTWIAGANYFAATGSTSIVGTNGATFYITGVQLEKGSYATPFDFRPIGTELALCQRYYYQQSTTGGYFPFGFGFEVSTTVAHIGIPLPVQMRSAPTFSSSAASTFYVQDAGSNRQASAISLQTSSPNYASVSLTVVGATAGAGAKMLDSGSPAFIGFSSEL